MYAFYRPTSDAVEVFDLLLERGATLDLAPRGEGGTGETGVTCHALHIAALTGQTGVLDKLLASKMLDFPISTPAFYGGSPLEHTQQLVGDTNLAQIVETLLDHGHHIDVTWTEEICVLSPFHMMMAVWAYEWARLRLPTDPHGVSQAFKNHEIFQPLARLIATLAYRQNDPDILADLRACLLGVGKRSLVTWPFWDGGNPPYDGWPALLIVARAVGIGLSNEDVADTVSHLSEWHPRLSDAILQGRLDALL